jgi:hypothetical protein
MERLVQTKGRRNVDVPRQPDHPQCQAYTFEPNVFTLFKAWEGVQGDDPQTALRVHRSRPDPVDPFVLLLTSLERLS